MANKIPCEIIKDLLPSYMDGLTNEVTNDAVEAHVENCEGCRNALYAMKTPIESEAELEEKHKEQQEEKQEIDFLKKNRKRNKRIITGCMVGAIVIAFAIILMNVYVIGDPVDGYTVDCFVQNTNKNLRITGGLKEEGQAISSYELKEENGVVTLNLKSVRANHFNAANCVFSLPIENKGSISQIKVGNRIIWDNGVFIDEYTSRVYQTKHLYVGDMSANDETVNALMLPVVERMNRLQTTEEPYEWEIILIDDLITSDKTEEKLSAYAYVLMATIDNLGVVTFDTINGPTVASFTAEEATEALGRDIKSYGESPANLQVLMEHVGLVSEKYADEISDITISYTE